MPKPKSKPDVMKKHPLPKTASENQRFCLRLVEDYANLGCLDLAMAESLCSRIVNAKTSYEIRIAVHEARAYVYDNFTDGEVLAE